MTTVKSLVKKKYHGVKPPTKEDAKLARSHLDRTMALEEQKVKEHEKQKNKAKQAGHKQSVKYNEAHIKNHKKDIEERKDSKKTIDQIWSKLETLRAAK